MEKELKYNKAIFFMDLKWKVHILLENGFVHNGIIENVEADFLLLEDERKGLIPIFFIEIIDIEKYILGEKKE